jgi:hypothetical protein
MPVARVVKPLKLPEGRPAGAASFLSWEKLEQTLRSAGAVHPSEQIDTFLLTDDGIYIVTKRAKSG